MPVQVDPLTGYRAYQPDQLARLNRTSDPFVSYYTERPEGEYHAYLTVAAPNAPDPLPEPAVVMTFPK